MHKLYLVSSANCVKRFLFSLIKISLFHEINSIKRIDILATLPLFSIHVHRLVHELESRSFFANVSKYLRARMSLKKIFHFTLFTSESNE